MLRKIDVSALMVQFHALGTRRRQVPVPRNPLVYGREARR
jgi:hypothetical protein